MDIAGDQRQRHIVGKTERQIGRDEVGRGPVPHLEIGLAPGNGAGRIGRGGCIAAFAQTGRDETPVALRGIARVAGEIQDVLGVVDDMGIGRIERGSRPEIAVDRHARTPAVVIIEPIAGGDVGRISAVVLVIAAGLDRDAVTKRHIDRRAHHLFVEAAIAHLGIATEFATGFAQDDRDRTAGRITPEQRPLRPAQHFDPLDVEQRQIVRILARQVDVVDIRPDRRVEGRDTLDIAETAQEIGVCRTQAGVVVGHEIRDELAELKRVGHPLRLKLRRGKRRDRDRHVLNAFRPPLRGDDDVLDPRLFALGGCGSGLLRGGLRHQRSDPAQRKQRNPDFEFPRPHNKPP